MTESTALATFANWKPDERVQEEAEEVPWLEALRICHGVSKAVEDDRAQIGDFMLGDKNIGREFLAIIGPDRAFALETEPKTPFKFIRKSNSVDDKDYQAIKAKSKARAKGCNYGPEFLLYLPELRKYATLWFKGVARSHSTAFYAARAAAPGKVVKVLYGRANNARKTPIPMVEVLANQPEFEIPTEEKTEAAMQEFLAYLQEEDAAEPARPR